MTAIIDSLVGASVAGLTSLQPRQFSALLHHWAEIPALPEVGVVYDIGPNGIEVSRRK